MRSKAVTKTVAAIVVVIIVVIAGIGVGLYSSMQPAAPTATTTSTMSSGLRDTLVIDELLWSGSDLNPIPPTLNIVGSDWWYYTVYQPLVTLNGSLVYSTGDTTQVLPDLATDWTVSPDGTVYTFNLRQNVTFSNGDPFNAYQVWGDWYEFYYLSGNSTSFMNGYQMFDMSNVQFGPATVALMTQSGVINPSPAMLKIMMDNTWPIYVTGPNQIVLHLKSPFQWMLQVLTMYVGLIMDTQYILENGGFGAPAAINTYFNQHAIPGTGPYVPTGFQLGSFEKFSQNPTYWGNSLTPAEIQANPYLDPGHVKNVILYAKGDDVVRYSDLSTGTAQIASIFTSWPLVLANPDKYDYFKMPNDALIIVGVGMNVMRYPTNITAFREAIVHAVNVTEVNQKVYYGTMVPMVGPEYRAAKEFYNLGNMPLYEYNLTLAQQYLKESGVNVATLAPLEFRVIAGCISCISAAQVIQADLGQIGITVTVEVTPPAELTLPYTAGYSSFQASAPVAQQEAHLAWMGFPTFAPEAPTPADAWVMFVNSKSPTGNFANYGNPIVDNCVSAWFTTTDVTAIKTACTAANQQIYSDAPYVWLGNPTLAFGGGSVVWDKTVVKGFLMDPDFTSQSTTAIFNTVTFVS